MNLAASVLAWFTLIAHVTAGSQARAAQLMPGIEGDTKVIRKKIRGYVSVTP